MIGPVLDIDVAAAFANAPVRAGLAGALYLASLLIALRWLRSRLWRDHVEKLPSRDDGEDKHGGLDR